MSVFFLDRDIWDSKFVRFVPGRTLLTPGLTKCGPRAARFGMVGASRSLWGDVTRVLDIYVHVIVRIIALS